MKNNGLTSDIINQLVNKVNGNSNAKLSAGNLDRYNLKKAHILVVFTGTDYGLNESLIELENGRENYGFSYSLGFSFSGARVIGEKGIDQIVKRLNPKQVYYEEDQLVYEKVLRSIDGMIVPMLTQDTVSKLALGISDNFISTLMWHGIWNGTTILMDFKNVRKFKNRESKSLAQQNILNRYISEISDMGIIEVEKNNYIPVMLDKFKNIKIELMESENISEIETKVEKFEVNKEVPKILTSKDLLELVGSSKSFRVPDTTIITPLALDTAKEKGIKITKEQ